MNQEKYAMPRLNRHMWFARPLRLLSTLALLFALLFALLPVPQAQAAGSGTVVAWGRNVVGESNVPAGLRDVIAVAGGDLYSLALKSDGSIIGWGHNTYGQLNVPAGLGPVIAIDAATYDTVALKSDGTVRVWGRGIFGEQNVPFGLSGVTAIAAGGTHVMALKNDGTVVAWGDNDYDTGATHVPADLSGVTAIAAGGFHSLALKSDGTVVGWGVNQSGQTDVPADLSGVTAIATGGAYSLALKSDGTVVAWGTGQGASVPADLSDVIAITAGGCHSVALKRDGTVVAWGCNHYGQLNVPVGLSSVTAIAAGNNHTLAIVPLVDTTAPVIAPAVSGTLGNNDWYTSDVAVSWTVTDEESSISGQSGCDIQTVSSDTAGVTFTCSASSAGGASSQDATVKRDATAPTISAAATSSPNANGWYNGDVSVAFTCDDNLSGVVSCPANQLLTGEGASISSDAETIRDLAGNGATSDHVYVAIDRTAPVVSVTGVRNGASYPLGSAPAAACSTTDALSGVVTEATLSLTGSGVGSITATCAGATDKAGNSGAASVTYTVAYRWSGFFQPIDNLPTINIAKAGSAIPIKFSLVGNYGLNIFAAGYPKVQTVSCSTGASSDEIEQTTTAGASSLSYDAATGQYSYTWKTDKSWARSCRLLTIRLIDGTDHSASFQFR
jgi:hypothetical protein